MITVITPRGARHAGMALLALAMMGLAAQSAHASFRIGPRDGGYYNGPAANAHPFCKQKVQQEISYYKGKYPTWKVRGRYKLENAGSLLHRSWRCRYWIDGDPS